MIMNSGFTGGKEKSPFQEFENSIEFFQNLQDNGNPGFVFLREESSGTAFFLTLLNDYSYGSQTYLEPGTIKKPIYYIDGGMFKNLLYVANEDGTDVIFTTMDLFNEPPTIKDGWTARYFIMLEDG